MPAATAPAHPPADIRAPRRDLARALGMWSATALVAGNVIGSGIFVAPADVARVLPNPVAALGAWVFGGLLSLAGALALAELAAAYPHTGGAYVYIHRAFGARTAFVFGWAELWVIRPAGAAGIAVIFAEHAGAFVPGVPVRALAAGAMIAVYALNFWSVRASSGLQAGLAVVKALALAAFATWAFAGLPSVAHAAPTAGALHLAGWGAACVAIVWTYDGWSEVAYVAGEIHAPQRALPRALCFGTAGVMGLYLLVNAAVVSRLSPAEMAADPAVVAQLATRLAGPAGGAGVRILVLVSTFGSLLAAAVTTPRLFFAMARDGLFLRRLGDVHPRFGTPAVSIVFVCAGAVLYVLTGTFTQIVTYFVFAMWLFYALTTAAVFVLRRREPDVPRPYRTPGYPVVPALFVLVSMAMLASVFVDSPRESGLGVLLVATGVPAYEVWRRSRKEDRPPAGGGPAGTGSPTGNRTPV